MTKRKLDICVLSDIHLGTYGCHADELLDYLNQIETDILVLNGDIIDAWQFNKKYFPESHVSVLQHFLQLSRNGTKVFYLAGNHDEFLRRHIPLQMESFYLDNKLVLEINDERLWFFHGDVFDASIQGSKWLAKLGGKGYDWLIRINHVINTILDRLNRPRMSLSKKVKESVKRAAKFIQDYEKIAAEHAIHQQYDRVICGHIHQPQIRKIQNHKGSVIYMNSGDWIENLTALEYSDKEWRIYHYETQTGSSKESKNNQMNGEKSKGNLKQKEIDIYSLLSTEQILHVL
ncbi:MAG: UDP-2,3-diacylglucosamine diphosphatase [Bacteroidetes bacterium]|jgi:UDP-2,3-diacylglucosamine pyrophosphatase LpxH|nr:UDP-2,3-diacylglucosamine diphosphatase [Bacteroidota bacterium]